MGVFQARCSSTTLAWRTPVASERARRTESRRDLRGQRSGLAQHAGGQHHVEAAHIAVPPVSAAMAPELPASGLQRVSGTSSSAALARTGLPRSEGLGGGFHGSHRVGLAGGQARGGDAAVQRVAALERGALLGRDGRPLISIDRSDAWCSPCEQMKGMRWWPSPDPGLADDVERASRSGPLAHEQPRSST